MTVYCPHCGFSDTDAEVDDHRATGIHNDEPQAGSNLPQRPEEMCQHEDTEYDPGNYLPPFGWEQHPGVFCLDCGAEIEQDEVDYPGAPGPDYEEETSA